MLNSSNEYLRIDVSMRMINIHVQAALSQAITSSIQFIQANEPQVSELIELFSTMDLYPSSST